MTDRVLGELVALRQQLRTVASSPGVHAARRLMEDVLPVLEPVWCLLVDDDSGVGFLRGLDPLGHAHNTVVATEAVHAYRSLDLAGPDMRAVWRVVSRPSVALVDSVRHPPRPRHVKHDGPVPARPLPATLGAAVRPALPRVLLSEWRDEPAVVPTLRRVLQTWCDLARNSTGERREVARLTLAAAMLARGAVLDGDVDTVKWFVKRWLGMAATDTRVDGTKAALLENGWHRLTVDDEFSVVRDSVTDLRVESMYQHRVHRPVWETQLRGAPVALLDEALTSSSQATNDTEKAVDRLMLKELLNDALGRLSTMELRAVQFTVIEGWTLAEAARELSITKYQLVRHRDRGMSKLRFPGQSAALRDYV
jgi:hypothetical protein